MTQEDKDLLIKEICARLPYGVIAKVYSYWNEEYFDDKLLGIDLDKNDVLAIALPGGRCEIGLVKPYLRPLSSMTEEEKEELNNIPSTKNYWIIKDDLPWDIANCKQIDWLNAYHFDYRGLISKGLALPSPKGMYIINNK